MTAPTPAVERAARKLTTFGRLSPAAWERITPSERGYWIANAQEALTAALTDPDDPDSLARTLWVLDRQALGLIPVSPAMFDQSPSRKHWRAVASGLRSALVGGAS